MIVQTNEPILRRNWLTIPDIGTIFRIATGIAYLICNFSAISIKISLKAESLFTEEVRSGSKTDISCLYQSLFEVDKMKVKMILKIVFCLSNLLKIVLFRRCFSLPCVIPNADIAFP